MFQYPVGIGHGKGHGVKNQTISANVIYKRKKDIVDQGDHY